MTLRTYRVRPPTVRAILWGDDGCKDALAEALANYEGDRSAAELRERQHPEDAECVQFATPWGWCKQPEPGEYILLDPYLGCVVMSAAAFAEKYEVPE
jgi:hypothetical protein